MPNINVGETDKSNFLDQQFIQIAYNGKVNAQSIPLTYRVTFIANDEKFYIIDVGPNQKVSAPIVAPIKEGYTFKHWDLYDEEFDFENTVITENINLIAKFEKMPVPSGYTTLATVKDYETRAEPDWGNGFDVDYDSVEIYNQFLQDAIAAGDMDKVRFKVSFDDNIFEDVHFLINEGGEPIGIGNASLNPSTGSSEDTGEDYFVGMYGGSDSNYLFVSCRNTGAHTFGIAYRIAEAPTPSGVYEWDGVVDVETDILLDGDDMYLHKVSNDVLTKPQLIGATLTVGENTGTLTDELIIVESGIAIVNGILWSGVGTLEDIEVNGTYFFSSTETPVHTKLTLAAPAPSSYTWNGTDTSDKDIGADDEHAEDLMHWITDDVSYTADDYIGATVICKLGDAETSYVVNEEDLDVSGEGDVVMIEMYKEESSSPLFALYKGLSADGIADGLYLVKTKATGEYTASLTLAD